MHHYYTLSVLILLCVRENLQTPYKDYSNDYKKSITYKENDTGNGIILQVTNNHTKQVNGEACAIYYKDKKVAGILTETVCKGEKVKTIYVGIGMNVNQEIFPGNLNEIATSLKKEFNQEFDREMIIVEFLNCFEKEYKRIVKNKY